MRIKPQKIYETTLMNYRKFETIFVKALLEKNIISEEILVSDTTIVQEFSKYFLNKPLNTVIELANQPVIEDVDFDLLTECYNFIELILTKYVLDAQINLSEESVLQEIQTIAEELLKYNNPIAEIIELDKSAISKNGIINVCLNRILEFNEAKRKNYFSDVFYLMVFKKYMLENPIMHKPIIRNKVAIDYSKPKFYEEVFESVVSNNSLEPLYVTGEDTDIKQDIFNVISELDEFSELIKELVKLNVFNKYVKISETYNTINLNTSLIKDEEKNSIAHIINEEVIKIHKKYPELFNNKQKNYIKKVNNFNLLQQKYGSVYFGDFYSELFKDKIQKNIEPLINKIILDIYKFKPESGEEFKNKFNVFNNADYTDIFYEKLKSRFIRKFTSVYIKDNINNLNKVLNKFIEIHVKKFFITAFNEINSFRNYNKFSTITYNRYDSNIADYDNINKYLLMSALKNKDNKTLNLDDTIKNILMDYMLKKLFLTKIQMNHVLLSIDNYNVNPEDLVINTKVFGVLPTVVETVIPNIRYITDFSTIKIIEDLFVGYNLNINGEITPIKLFEIVKTIDRNYINGLAPNNNPFNDYSIFNDVEFHKKTMFNQKLDSVKFSNMTRNKNQIIISEPEDLELDVKLNEQYFQVYTENDFAEAIKDLSQNHIELAFNYILDKVLDAVYEKSLNSCFTLEKELVKSELSQDKKIGRLIKEPIIKKSKDIFISEPIEELIPSLIKNDALLNNRIYNKNKTVNILGNIILNRYIKPYSDDSDYEVIYEFVGANIKTDDLLYMTSLDVRKIISAISEDILDANLILKYKRFTMDNDHFSIHKSALKDLEIIEIFNKHIENNKMTIPILNKVSDIIEVDTVIEAEKKVQDLSQNKKDYLMLVLQETIDDYEKKGFSFTNKQVSEASYNLLVRTLKSLYNNDEKTSHYYLLIDKSENVLSDEIVNVESYLELKKTIKEKLLNQFKEVHQYKYIMNSNDYNKIKELISLLSGNDDVEYIENIFNDVQFDLAKNFKKINLNTGDIEYNEAILAVIKQKIKIKNRKYFAEAPKRFNQITLKNFISGHSSFIQSDNVNLKIKRLQKMFKDSEKTYKHIVNHFIEINGSVVYMLEDKSTNRLYFLNPELISLIAVKGFYTPKIQAVKSENISIVDFWNTNFSLVMMNDLKINEGSQNRKDEYTDVIKNILIAFDNRRKV